MGGLSLSRVVFPGGANRSAKSCRNPLGEIPPSSPSPLGAKICFGNQTESAKSPLGGQQMRYVCGRMASGGFRGPEQGGFRGRFAGLRHSPPNQGAKNCFRICFWSAEFPLAAGKCDVYQSNRTLGGISRATKNAHLHVCGIPPVGDFADPKRRDFADLFWVPKTACANQHRQGVFRAPFEHRHANPHQNQKKRKGDSTY